ncbi:DUF2218 domain-containing protein [Nocardia fluminea]
MATTEARITTDRAERYLAQLCRHASTVGSGEHLPHGGPPWLRDVTVEADWSDTTGTITFAPLGRCDLTATADTLIARIDASDAAHLEKIQTIIGNNLERMSHRNPLTVHWIRTETAHEQEEPGPPAAKTKRHPKLRVASITVLAALAVIAHLVLSGSLITDLRLTSTVGILALALLVFKLATIALAGRGLIALGRGGHHDLAAEIARSRSLGRRKA